MTPRPALVTIVSGRHLHLRRQRQWIAAMTPRPARHIVVSLGDPQIGRIVAELDACPTEVAELPAAADLPLAAARNLGVRLAAEAGADQVVLLDVDCLPAPELVADYAEQLAALPCDPAVICGRVRYLPAGIADQDHRLEILAAKAADHPLRVVPPGRGLVAGDPRLLWSLNIGLRICDWERIGGFDERYVGYGAEDTDFGQRLARVGGTMWWSGRAQAFHQYHPVSDPPTEHAADIARNANLFASIWGFEPMSGWLDELATLGVLERGEDGGWRLVVASTPW